MSAVLTVTCDRCRRPVETDRHLIRFDSGSARDRRPEIDLCRGCAGWLLAALDGPGDEPEGADAPPPGDRSR